MRENSWKSLGSILEEQFTQEAIRNRPKSLKTGFSQLDKILGGGLNAGLTVLGGSTGLGKSTFALQLAEQVSESDGQIPVLYFSLEMSSEWIAAKAISRRYFKEARSEEEGHGSGGQIGIAANELLDPETAGKWPEEKWRRIREIRECVQRNRNLYIIEKAVSAGEISDIVKAFMTERAASGNGTPPLVIVDYLQILLSDNPKAGTGKQGVEDSLKAMVELSRNKVPVILISSLNRNSYDRPMQRDSFKETGSIEYSADVLLGLQFCACHKKEDWDINEEQNKFPREVEISILKQRYGGSGETVRFKYYAKFDYFEEAPGAPTLSFQTMPTSTAPKNVDVSSSEAPKDVDVSSVVTNNTPPKKRTPRAIKSQPFYINNTKIANEIRAGARAGERISCQVFSEITTEYELSEPLSGFDCNVADAIYTLYNTGSESFSLGQVLKTLSGDQRQTPTEQNLKKIAASIEKLSNVRIEIDCTAEMRARKKISDSEEKIISGSFLSARKAGKDQYTLGSSEAMPLYRYGEMTTQMVRFPSQLLAVYAGGKKLSDTLENINIKRFLIRRLEVIRHPDPSRQSSAGGRSVRQSMRSISFRENSGIFFEAGINKADFKSKSAWKHKSRTVCDTVVKILECYRQIGYIADYQEKSTGSIEILGEIADPWELE